MKPIQVNFKHEKIINNKSVINTRTGTVLHFVGDGLFCRAVIVDYQSGKFYDVLVDDLTLVRGI